MGTPVSPSEKRIEKISEESSSLPKRYVLPHHLGYLALVVFSVLTGVAMLLMPDEYRLTVILVPPALALSYLILTNPYAGLYVFYFYEFLRPYDYIYALRPLRLAIIVEFLILVGWLIRLRNIRRLNWDKLIWPFLIFLGMLGSSVLTAVVGGYALRIFQPMIVYLILMIIAINIDMSVKRLNWILWMLLFVHLFFAIVGTKNYLTGAFVFGGQRTSGIIGSSFLTDENDFALAINIMIPLAYFTLVVTRSLWQKLLAIGILGSMLVAVVCTFSRGGMLGLAAALLYCLLNSANKLRSLGVAVLIGVAALILVPQSYWTEASTIPDVNEATADKRIKYWEAAFWMYVDHPIIGVGAGNGGVHLPDYAGAFRRPNIEWGRAFHGTIPQVMAELGTIGLVAYLLMAYWAIRYLLMIKRRRVRSDSDRLIVGLANGLLGGIIAFFVSATFLSVPYYPQLWMLYTFTLVLRVIDRSDRTPEESEAVVV